MKWHHPNTDILMRKRNLHLYEYDIYVNSERKKRKKRALITKTYRLSSMRFAKRTANENCLEGKKMKLTSYNN